MSLQLTGTIKHILPAKSGTTKDGNSWSNQEFVIEYKDGEYTKHGHFECRGKAMETLGQLTEGQEVEVKFNIDAREWNGRWFPKNNAWGIRAVSEKPAQHQTYTGPGNDLPF